MTRRALVFGAWRTERQSGRLLSPKNSTVTLWIIRRLDTPALHVNNGVASALKMLDC
jgi:hypothetical protein